MKNKQREFNTVSAEAFNLAGEVGIDPDRVVRERQDAEQRRRDAEEFAAKNQRILLQCPGVIGADAPTGPEAEGRVVIEPAFTMQAVAWLRRRFRVRAEIEVDAGTGLAISVKARRCGGRTGGRRLPVTTWQIEQFELEL